MSISIVIPTKNRVRDLTRCLYALSKQSAPSLEIVVIDNGSTDGTWKKLAEFPAVKAIWDPTPCLPRLFNVGWMASSGEIIGFLNDDAEPCANWVEQVSHWFQTLPDAGAIGGPMHDLALRRMKTAASRHSLLLRLYDEFLLQGRLDDYGLQTRWGAYSIGDRGPLEPTLVTALTITNMAVKRSVLEKYSGFDETFQFSNYDGMLFDVLNRGGVRMYAVPTASVIHHVNPSGSTRSAFYLAADYAVFHRKLSPSGFKERSLLQMNSFASLLFWAHQTIIDRKWYLGEALRGHVAGKRRVMQKSWGASHR